MPKASEIATELRRIADHMDRTPDAQAPQAMFSFYCFTKEGFMNAARLIPRPCEKGIQHEGTSYASMRVGYENKTIEVKATVDRSKVCMVIEPAKPAVYDCPSIFSPEEEASLAE